MFGATETKLAWESTWTDYGHDGWFRCEYKFKSFNGYFKVTFEDQGTDINDFDGTHYLLPDSFEPGQHPPNALYGTIKVSRVSKTHFEFVKPPAHLTVWPA